MDLTQMPVVDGHYHPFTVEHQHLGATQLRDIMMFMQQGGSPAEALDTITAHLFVRELASVLNCEPEFAEVLRVRNEAAADNYAGYVERILAMANVSALLVDTGSDGLAIPELHTYGLMLAEHYAGLICHETAERVYALR